MSAAVEIRELHTRADRKRFLELPYRLRRGDANWVAPLRGDEARTFAAQTAFFERAEMALLLAERAGAAVARAAAIHNRAHNDHHGDRVGFFGFFECAPGDGEAARAVLAGAEAWLAGCGLEAMRGPVNPSMNAECGLLIDGFDDPPMILMPHNPPEYAAMLESAGLSKCKDLFAYRVRLGRVCPGNEGRERLERVSRAARRRWPELSLRCLDMRRYEDDVRRFLHVFEEARSSNWGYVPVSEKEVLETARKMKPLVDPEVVILAEVDGEPAGASLALPNANRALAGLNGRLLPLGWLKLLWRLRRLDEMRVFGIAALERYRHRGITALLLLETILRGTPRGYRTAEASWVLEDNTMSNRTIDQTLAPEHYKTYRIYEKPIGRGALRPGASANTMEQSARNGNRTARASQRSAASQSSTGGAVLGEEP